MIDTLIRKTTVLVILISIFIGSSVSINAQYSCFPSGLPVTVTDSLNSSDALQTGRVVRDSLPSSCNGKTNILQNSNQVRHDVQNFTNPTGQKACVTVDVDFSGCGFNDLEAVAYSNYNPANPAANIIGDLGFSTSERGSFSFPVNAGSSFSLVVHEITPNSGCPIYSYKVSYSTNCRQPGFDRNNDKKADLGLFTPDGFWETFDLSNNSTEEIPFGVGTDLPVTGDFSGDGKSDLNVFRASENSWYFLTTPGNSFSAAQWGTVGDIPLAGDIDRDGKADLFIYRQSTGNWYILRSSDNTFVSIKWGLTGDKPLTGDFDGDLITDVAVYRVNQEGLGTWYILTSNFNNGFYTAFQWGLSTDIPVPADYDGDTLTDIAVYRPSDGTWYVYLGSEAIPNPFLIVRWGTSEDIPQPADYDGDGTTDFAVYRPSAKFWYILGSTDGFMFKQFGNDNDKPITYNVR